MFFAPWVWMHIARFTFSAIHVPSCLLPPFTSLHGLLMLSPYAQSHPHSAQVPTANNALIMAQVAGAGDEAVALVIFWQYLVAPVFVSGWTALALATLWPKVAT